MNAHPTSTESSESAAETRHSQVQNLLDDADARDDQADARDSAAEDRDSAAALESFLDPDADYDVVVRTRRAAALDRTASKDDRSSAADDRSVLASDHEHTEAPEGTAP